MNAPSQLESFLREHQNEGAVQSEGQFTISREEALRKLASFQLPFEFDWAIKLIQAAVAGGENSPIKVDLTNKEARFYFSSPGLTLDVFEEAFFDPEPHPRRAIQHLMSGLWSVGIHSGQPFLLERRDEAECLVWDGKNLRRIPSTKKYNCCVLTVYFQKKDDSKLDWLKGMVNAGTRNANLLSRLTTYCYTSPVRLTVDGRRLDSLYNCPSHGLGVTTFPICLGMPESELPEVGIPPGTFQDVTRDPAAKFLTSSKVAHASGLRKAATDARIALEKELADKSSGCPYLFSSHWKWQRSGRYDTCVAEQVPSYLYWVQDGVVIDSELLVQDPMAYSLAVFVDAQDLKTDLTGFKLHHSPERDTIVRQVQTAMATSLQEVELLDKNYDWYVKEGTWKYRIVGCGLVAIGMAFTVANPIVGLGCMAGGAWGVKQAGRSERDRVKKIVASMSYLAKRLAAKAEL